MAATVVNHTHAAIASAAGTTGIALTVPAGGASGDLLVAVIASQTSSTAQFGAAGWTSIGPTSTSASGTRVITTLTKTWAPGDTNFTFTHSAALTRTVGVMLLVRGYDPAIPIAVSPDFSSNATTQTLTTHAPAAQVAGSLLLAVGTSSAGAGLAIQPVTSPRTSTAIEYQSPDVPISDTTASRTTLSILQGSITGAASDESMTFQTAAIQKSGYVVVIPPLAVAAPGAGYNYWDGSAERKVTGKAWNGTSEIPLVSGPTVHVGNHTIASMTAVEPFYVAHRGGSRSWPEMTSRAYALSAAMRMPALEVSAHRSSDGVWVCNHDATTGRVGTPNLTIATSTWASLSGVAIGASGTDNPGQPSQPMVKLTDVLDKYASTHVIFIEDKTANNQQSLIDLIKTYPNYADHFIWKMDGNGSNFQTTFPTNAGLRSWGYFFTGFDQATFAASAARFTYIGVDHGFTATEWQIAESIGKPMIGHIVQTRAQLDTILAHPVVGVMLANVRDLAPGRYLAA